MRRKWVPLFICALFGVLPMQALAQTSQDKPLYAVFDAVLKNSPLLHSGVAAVDVAKAGATQAALRPNPSASFEVENFSGNNEFSGVNNAEMTIGFTQEVEIAGKRRLRREVSGYDVSIAHQNAMASALSLLAEAHQTYAAYVIAEERVALAEKRRALADKMHDAVKKRVRVAVASDIQHTQADIEQHTAGIEKSKAERDLRNAVLRLERLTATNMAQFAADTDFLKTIPDIPPEDMFVTSIVDLPQMHLLKLKELQAQSISELARSNAVPNPTIGLGVRRLNDADRSAFLASISFPLPVFDRNQGKRQEARALREQTEFDKRAGELLWTETARNIHAGLQVAVQNVLSYRDKIIPGAQKAYEQAAQGYEAGRFSFLQMLNAQRTLYEAQGDYLSNLLALHEAKAQADFLMGVHRALVENTMSLREGESQ